MYKNVLNERNIIECYVLNRIRAGPHLIGSVRKINIWAHKTRLVTQLNARSCTSAQVINLIRDMHYYIYESHVKVCQPWWQGSQFVERGINVDQRYVHAMTLFVELLLNIPFNFDPFRVFLTYLNIFWREVESESA